MYRQYHKREIPVYDEVRGMAVLTKVRGEDLWTAYVNVTRCAVSDMMLLLQLNQGKYVYVHSHKTGSNVWLRELTLQTNDPTEE